MFSNGFCTHVHIPYTHKPIYAQSHTERETERGTDGQTDRHRDSNRNRKKKKGAERQREGQNIWYLSSETKLQLKMFSRVITFLKVS